MTVDWHDTKVAPDGTHHEVAGQPAYSARFLEVMKFHAPGLAPALDGTGAFHIDTAGAPAYDFRYRRTFGFYEGMATVVGGDGWFHIRPDGTPAYARRWGWCGNFQGGFCTVRTADGHYGHIRPDGEPATRIAWRYAGDFRDGIAVVQAENGRSTHIDGTGALIHGRWFLDLDVFHKGFARARDDFGWMHSDREGRPAYERRFAAVEPFYNGQARVERFDGGLEVVGEDGCALVGLRPARHRSEGGLRPAKLLLVGLPGAGKSTIGEELARQLGIGLHRLDDYRRAMSDGTVSGDYLARAAFLRECASPASGVYEFSATGYHRVAVRQAFREGGARLLAAWIDTPAEVRRGRLARRKETVPLPDWGIPPGAFDNTMEGKLQADFDSGWWINGPGWRAVRLNGTLGPSEAVAQLIAGWRELEIAP